MITSYCYWRFTEPFISLCNYCLVAESNFMGTGEDFDITDIGVGTLEDPYLSIMS